MSPHVISSLRQKLSALHLILLVVFLIPYGFGIMSSTAQSTQDEERKFENAIPNHLPIKVKLKNEQAFKNLNNDKWARDIEVEVENRSDKPIYHLLISLTLPDVLT